jgi:hypothetical protein
VTTRLAWLASEYFQTHLLLATVRAEHRAFYRRVFGHRLICGLRHYPLRPGDRNRLLRRQRSRKLWWERQAQEEGMSADGTWTLSMQTPIGERKSTLALKSSGGTVTGKLTGEEGNSTDIFDGAVSGDKVTFKAAIKNPMPLTLEFTASVAGDKISGNVSASGVGSWPFSGTRG